MSSFTPAWAGLLILLRSGVDMATKTSYKKGVNSPYEPMVGAIILYRPARNVATGPGPWPGIITEKVLNDPNDRCSLTVFTPQGLLHVSRIPYSEDPTRDNVWFWASAPERRNIEKDKSSQEDCLVGQTGQTVEAGNSNSETSS